MGQMLGGWLTETDRGQAAGSGRETVKTLVVRLLVPRSQPGGMQDPCGFKRAQSTPSRAVH